ncbi:unnamed protein product [marine sediment metagenome]|uniref:YopX protein domain-containing protein n=1 Tax=marine sediment metagenome TaxID=412755 RepID=X0T3A9_9ZZZZ
MRPCRARKIDNGVEVKGWLFERAGASFIIPISDEFHTPASFVLTFVQVDPATVGQSTGLKDKNGKEEAYCGDIIEAFFYNSITEKDFSIKGEVYWDESFVGYYLKPFDGQENMLPHRLSRTTSFEIIGNIREE